MLIGLISDAHGNRFGFSAALFALRQRGVEKLVSLGDIVGCMPDVSPIVAELTRREAICLRGNHEEMLLGNLPLDIHRDRVYRIMDARARLNDDERAIISSWHPSQYTMEIDGRRLGFFHGSPFEPATGYVYPDTGIGAFARLDFDAVFMGHTHRPFKKWAERVQVVNVGSCGLPRDRGNLASCAVYDTRTGKAEILRVRFEAGRALRAYEDKIAKSIRDCLLRRPSAPVVGTIIEPVAAA
jgi:putative phosphoesterase